MSLVINEAGQELEKRKNEMLQNTDIRVTESSCNRAFHTTCLGRAPAAAHARQLTCTRGVFEEGSSVPLGQEFCLKDFRHRLCTTCLVECTGSSGTMYSVKLPGKASLVAHLYLLNAQLYYTVPCR